MAVFAGTTIFEVETGGDDSNNGGAFDPGQTAGMFTDGAATSATTAAPVFTSASYNFVAGDAGAWLYIASGTNWIAGWYHIDSVGSNAATLNATAGAGVLPRNEAMTSVTGCATTASPTGATWSIDYSQQAASRYAYTDLASSGAGLTVSSVAKPFAKEQVGNCIVITGGANFNTGRYIIASVAAGVATVKGANNITSGAGANGVGAQGGALASPGMLASVMTTNNVEGPRAFVGGGTYTITSASTNIAAGCCNFPLVNQEVIGYTSHRTVVNTDTQPIWKINSGLSSAAMITNGRVSFYNLTFDGNAQTSASHITTGSMGVIRCTIKNFTAASGTTQTVYVNCYATGNSAAVFPCSSAFCVATANTATPFVAGDNCIFDSCLSYANTGGSTYGFSLLASACVNCVSYNNGKDGYVFTSTVSNQLVNCVAEANAGYAVDDSARTYANAAVINCAFYNNTSGVFRSGTTTLVQQIGTIIPSVSPFTSAGTGDFSLNTTSNGGALLRAAGYPGLFPGGTSTSALDVGAIQHADPPSAGGGAVFIFGG